MFDCIHSNEEFAQEWDLICWEERSSRERVAPHAEEIAQRRWESAPKRGETAQRWWKSAPTGRETTQRWLESAPTKGKPLKE